METPIKMEGLSEDCYGPGMSSYVPRMDGPKKRFWIGFVAKNSGKPKTKMVEKECFKIIVLLPGFQSGLHPYNTYNNHMMGNHLAAS